MLVLNTLILGQHEFFKKASQSGEENPVLNPNSDPESTPYPGEVVFNPPST